MFQTLKWELTPSTPSLSSDHAVPQLSTHLKGKKIALMVCAGIAAIKISLLARSLRRCVEQERPQRVKSKSMIAQMIRQYLEDVLSTEHRLNFLRTIGEILFILGSLTSVSV